MGMHSGERPDAAAETIDKLCDAFEHAWRCGQKPNLPDYLKRVDPSARGQLFCQLLLVELELRIAGGEKPVWNELTERFPSFASQIEDLRIRHDIHGLVTDKAAGGDSADPRISRRIGRYELHERLGSGGAGEVWKAWDPRLQRWVALKFPHGGLSENSLSRFLREARATAALVHPNIVSIYEVDRQGHTPYIVARYIDGDDLKTWLTKTKVSPREAAELCRNLALAVHHAHELGVIHRDLTPRNILIDRAGNPFIADFGLAKFAFDTCDLTLDGLVVGTPAYMSPEQARGEGYRANRRTDVYGLGILLYEILTGRAPFQGDRDRVAYMVLHHDPEPPLSLEPSTSRDLETICLKAIAKDAGRRYPTAGEMAADLWRFLEHEPILARRAHPIEKGWRWLKRRPLVAAIIATAFVALFALEMARRMLSENYALQGFRDVTFTTEPGGARLAIARLSDQNAEPDPSQVIRPRGVTPVTVSLRPGDYLIVAASSENRFHEVYRRVPARDQQLTSPLPHLRWDVVESGAIAIPTIQIPRTVPTQAMAYVECSQLATAEDKKLGHCPGFFIDCNEMTAADLALQLAEISVDETTTSEVLKVVRRNRDYDNSLFIAELLGKRLPSEAEFECAAACTSSVTRDSPAMNIGINQNPGSDKIEDLLAGLAEWTTSTEPVIASDNTSPSHAPDFRVIRGAASNTYVAISNTDVRHGRALLRRVESNAGIGFRCVRSKAPRFLEF